MGQKHRRGCVNKKITLHSVIFLTEYHAIFIEKDKGLWYTVVVGKIWRYTMAANNSLLNKANKAKKVFEKD